MKALGALGGSLLICMVKTHQLSQGVYPPPTPHAPTRPPGSCRLFSLPVCVQFSGGHVEELSGFIGVTDGQADGSDVLQRLYHKKKKTHLKKKG